MAFASGIFALIVLTIASGIVILGFQIYYAKTAKKKEENKPKIGSINFLLSSGIMIFIIITLLLVILMVFNVGNLFMHKHLRSDIDVSILTPPLRSRERLERMTKQKVRPTKN